MRLLFTETASLVYEIESENGFDNFGKNKEMFDLSNYSAKSKYYYDSNVLVVGKIKDEMVHITGEVFLGLKSKFTQFLRAILVNIKKQNV